MASCDFNLNSFVPLTVLETKQPVRIYQNAVPFGRSRPQDSSGKNKQNEGFVRFPGT